MAFRSFPVVSSQPCTTQPSSSNPSSDTRQSQSPYRDWKSSLTDCCVDKQICICGALSPCVLACQVSSSLGECCCLPCLPGSMVAARTALREQLRIEDIVPAPALQIDMIHSKHQVYSFSNGDSLKSKRSFLPANYFRSVSGFLVATEVGRLIVLQHRVESKRHEI
ncbi:hypothetical protein L345_16775, partial [Ophiophagus hannah]